MEDCHRDCQTCSDQPQPDLEDLRPPHLPIQIYDSNGDRAQNPLEVSPHRRAMIPLLQVPADCPVAARSGNCLCVISPDSAAASLISGVGPPSPLQLAPPTIPAPPSRWWPWNSGSSPNLLGQIGGSTPDTRPSGSTSVHSLSTMKSPASFLSLLRSPSMNSPGSTPQADILLSLDDISKHDRADDCWVIVNSRVFDVTRFLQCHPAGAETILKRGGRDATRDFYFHSASAQRIWAGMPVVGRVDPAGMRELRRMRTQQGIVKYHNSDACLIV
eukprot:Partr_v1_DN24227_c2_g1_i1_m36779